MSKRKNEQKPAVTQTSIKAFTKTSESGLESDEPAVKKTKTSDSADEGSSNSSAPMDTKETKVESKPKKLSEARFEFKAEWKKKWPFIYKLDSPEEKEGLYCEICQSAKKG